MTTKQVELIEKKKFTAAALDLKYKSFIVYITTFSVNLNDEMHFLKRAKIAYLKVDEASTKVSSKYANFADVFSPKLAVELVKHIGINNHTIELIDN